MKINYAQSARTLVSLLRPLAVITIAIIAGQPAVIRAQCPAAPTTHSNGVVEGPVTPTDQRGQESAAAIDMQGRFLIAWRKPGGPGEDGEIRVLRFDSSGLAVCNGDPKVISGDAGIYLASHTLPSVAMTGGGAARVAWQASSTQSSANAYEIVAANFNYDDSPATWPVLQPPFPIDRKDKGVSVALSPAGTGAFTWVTSQSDVSDPYNGILHALTPSNPSSPFVDCNPDAQFCEDCETCDCNFCFLGDWQPCVARTSSLIAVVWANAEEPENFGTKFDVYLQLFDSTFSPIGSAIVVNDPGVEQAPSSQISPAIAIDGNRIVVAWHGGEIPGCSSGRVSRVYARLFFWDDEHHVLSGPPMFKVDGGVSDSEPANGINANPTVAFTNSTDPLLDGRFFICWNGGPSSAYDAIYGQYFNPNGLPMGQAIRVNQEGGDTTERRIEESAQHTAACGPDGQVLVTWRKYTTTPSVYFTLLPAGFAEANCAESVCVEGDADNDSDVDLADVDDFVDTLLTGFVPQGSCDYEAVFDLCRFDMNKDCLFDGLDIQCFTLTVLGQEEDCTFGLRFMDCNANSVPDGDDIENETSEDVNSNGLPDECEVDCNTNGVPDDWDVAQATSGDCNTNGVPDECEGGCNSNGVPDSCDVDVTDPDGNQQVSADCNGNGEPDECEQDCNTNGVPDECDLDPSDPDGNQEVSADCNGDLVPDECNLMYPPPLGSSDCNANEILDECDIAACESDPACGDCNENGIPDSCDIAAEISEDANTNGIPDECEGEGMMGGGGESMMSGGEGGEESESGQAEAWEAYYEWAAGQCWGSACEMTGAEQFAAMVAKLQELGLPVTGSTMVP